MLRNSSVACIAYSGEKVLIARRKFGGDMGGRWEFPGGKVEPDETDLCAAVREFKEEFGIDVKIGGYICETEFEHGGKKSVLRAYEVFVPHDGIEKSYALSEHLEYKWADLAEIEKLNFVDSDMKLYPSVKDYIMSKNGTRKQS
ncbi:NUDIX domain-containing protein [Treponema parvum]|uniref:8-oxo-dGTP diphosphatase n=1 Tax=Treponema parvum TaxID=138851 RepID=A0A975F0B1_9SPIR|nr:NUDIX domain-containing protein [Treponema parvum]QTQ12154.1 NUDIX domain-containing protein [Treponema parvum]